MAEKEINVIGHLLDVEKDASTLVSDAQTESAKRLAAARAKADADYKKQYDTLTAALETDLQKRNGEVTRRHDDALSAYKSETAKTERDDAAFNTFLDSILFTA